MQEADVGVVRSGFEFAQAKSHPGDQYDWSYFDGLVRSTAEKGIDFMPVLFGAPPWISSDVATPPIGSWEGIWTNYVTAVVKRYGSDGAFWSENPEVPKRPIEDWQVWNEPNSRTWWRPRPDPKEYGKLLVMSAKAIHAADPQSRVLTAGIVAEPTNSGAIPGNEYLRGLYKSKAARRATDVVAFHPYAPTTQDVERQLRSARKTLGKVGMKKTPIAVTEIGWGSEGPKNHPLILPEAKLETEFRKLLQMAADQRRRIGLDRFLWYQWQDHPDPICLWCLSSGLIDDGGDPKPLLGIFESIARL